MSRQTVAVQSSRGEADNAVSQRKLEKCNYASLINGGVGQYCNIGMFGIQAKFSVGASDDPLEYEADRMADWVVNSSRSPAMVKPAPLSIQRAGTAHASAAAAPSIVGQILRGVGEPLDKHTRGEMESHFAHDFSRVRVHHDSRAQRSADAINAKAYTLGSDIVFGKGHYAPVTQQGKHLLAHELTHVVQQSGGGNAVVQRDVVDDAREKLSYGFLDWAITDAEANDALALLSTIPVANLPAALTRLGTKYVNRLLDNLPDAAKSGEVYERIISALGSAGTTAYAQEQLSFGLFDWGISSNEVARVFNIFTNLPVAEREKFLVGLNNSGKLIRLLRNASYGQYTMHLVPWVNSLTRGRLTTDQRAVMRTLVKKAPASPIDVIKLAVEVRYDVTAGPTTIPGRTAVAWDAEKLRDTYLALDDLPAAHVARNAMLTRFGQFSQPSRELADGSTAIVSGVYNQGQTELASNIKKSGDISGTLIHETGHAVDAQMGWSTGAEPAKASRGGWLEYAGHATCATDMVTDSNDGINNTLNAAQQVDVVADMSNAMTNRSTATLKSDIRARAWFAGLSARDKDDVMEDKALEAIKVGLETPWFTRSDGGVHLGNHVYQESYTPTWVRYLHAARARKVEDYQFRDAGEWFAECYAAYYDPKNKNKGDRLNKADPNTKIYFDNHVDTLATSR